MEIKVFSEREIQKFVTNKKHVVISVQEPNYDFVKLPKQESELGWMGIWFYDIDTPTGQIKYDKFLFEKIHAITILSFVKEWKDRVDLICVNCVAGISRSAAIAAAISKLLNNNDDYYFKYYCPNMRAYGGILKEYYENKTVYNM